MVRSVIQKQEQNSLVTFLLPALLILMLVAMRLGEGYLLFHSVVELFAVIEGILIAVIAYYMYPFTRNNFLLFLGIGFFWVASLDLFHMLSYHGMNLYSETSSFNTPTSLWVFTRILETVTILAAPFVRFKKISPTAFFIIIGSVAVGIYTGTFMSLFPVMYVAETGLTPIKIAIEYGIIILNLFGMLIYRYKRNNFNPMMYRMIQLSLLLGIAAESCFTFYTDFYGFSNFLGHIFKFLSYWVIFQGVAIMALKEPFSIMAKSSYTYDAIPLPVVVSDSDGVIRQVNTAAAVCAMKPVEDMIGQHNHDLMHPNDIPKAECPICQAIKSGDYANIEADLGDRYKLYTISPIQIEKALMGSLQICTDLTERKRAEKAVENEKEKAQNYLDIVAVMIVVLDKDYNIQIMNRRGCEIIGYQIDEVIGKSFAELFVPERFRTQFIDVADSLFASDGPGYYENLIITKTGEERLIAWRNQVLLDNENRFAGILSSGEDITDIRDAQLKLKEGKEFYQTMFTSLSEAVIVLQDNIIIDCNDSALILFETEKNVLLMSNILEVLHDVECQEHTFIQYINASYQGAYNVAECSVRLHPDINESKIVEFTFSTFGKKEEKKLILIARDITKQIEEDKLFKMNTRQAQMGEMISLIAHQWRQPLAIINAIISQMRLKAMLEGEDETSEYVKNLIKVEEQSVHLSQTISDYRDFFRPDKPKEHFTASSLLQNALSLIDHTLKNHSIEILNKTVLDTVLYTYRNELLQVLIVLLKNALDMFLENTTTQGKIIVSVNRDDKYCLISVYDNAGGIPKEVMEKLFVPYFTTKDKSVGTGLGLYMSRLIVHEHCHGTIDVFSQGLETIFTIKLPYDKEAQ